jgi:membrane protein DedA with SNARE-associated domain
VVRARDAIATEDPSPWYVDLVERFGGLGSALATAGETFFPPVPSEGVLLVGGYLASLGRLGLASLILWSTAGSLGSALMLYYLGAWLGRDRSRALLTRLPLVRNSDFDRCEAWFARRGRQTVFYGRMIPGIRSFVSLPAGIERMPIVTFVLYTTVGSLGWNSLLIGLGYLAGRNWPVVSDYVGLATALVVGATIFLIVRFFVRRRREARQPAGGQFS